MCKPASMVVMRDRVYWSKRTDSHENNQDGGQITTSLTIVAKCQKCGGELEASMAMSRTRQQELEISVALCETCTGEVTADAAHDAMLEAGEREE